MNYNLSNDQVNEYNENGYLIVENVIHKNFLNELNSATDKILKDAALINNSDEQFDLGDHHTSSKPSVRRIKQPQKHSDVFKKLLFYPSIIQKVISLLGNNFRLHNGKMNLKSPSAGDLVDWHQDWAFYPHSNDDVLAVGIMLDDMTLDNGTVLFIPGSHKGEVYDHHHNGYFAGAIDTKKSNIDLSNVKEITGKAGTITIHHARLLHASKPNISKTNRRFLLWEFAANDAWPLMGINNYEEFNKKIISGNAINNPRLTQVPVRMPLPAAINQGSIFENQKTITKNKKNILI